MPDRFSRLTFIGFRQTDIRSQIYLKMLCVCIPCSAFLRHPADTFFPIQLLFWLSFRMFLFSVSFNWNLIFLNYLVSPREISTRTQIFNKTKCRNIQFIDCYLYVFSKTLKGSADEIWSIINNYKCCRYKNLNFKGLKKKISWNKICIKFSFLVTEITMLLIVKYLVTHFKKL